MKKSIILFALFGLFLGLAKAQTPRFINVELLGVHNLIGVSFDSRFTETSRFGYKVGVGYGYEKSNSSHGWNIEMGGKNATFRTSPVGFVRGLLLKNVVSMPLSVYYLFGSGNGHFELGAGVVPYYAEFKDGFSVNDVWYNRDFNQFKYYGFLQTAYRYEAEQFVYSVGLDIPINTPGANFRQLIGIYPKLSIGYRL